MTSRPLVLSLLLALLAGGAALAQSSPTATTDPFSASGGEIELLGKHSNGFSGSFGITASRSQLPFSSGNGYSGSLAGTIVPDRMWFFAAAERTTPMFAQTPVAGVPAIHLVDAKGAAQIGERQDVTAWFGSGVRPAPSTFMTLHYTGVVSSNSFFTADISRR